MPKFELYNLFRVAVAYLIALGAIRLTISTIGDEMKDIFRYIGNEIRSTLRARPTLKALNAYGLAFLLLVILFLGYVGFSSMPKPNANATPIEIALLENGARAFYVLSFLMGFLGSILLTRFERD